MYKNDTKVYYTEISDHWGKKYSESFHKIEEDCMQSIKIRVASEANDIHQKR